MSRAAIARKRRRFEEPDSGSEFDDIPEAKYARAESSPGDWFHQYTAQKKEKLACEGRAVAVDNKWVKVYTSKGGSRCHNNIYYPDALCCRQMSKYFAEHDKRGVPGSYEQVLTSKEAIDKTDLPLNLFDKEAHEFRGDRYIFSSIAANGLGKCLYLACDGMTLGSKKTFLLASENHIMSVTVHYKADELYVVKFWDPNQTERHFPALCYDLRAIKTLRLGYFLKQKRIDYYWPSLKSCVLIEYFDIKNLSPYHEGGVLELVEEGGNDLKAYLYFSVLYARLDSLTEVMSMVAFASPAIYPPDKKLALLGAADGVAYKAIKQAVMENHVLTLQCYYDWVFLAPTDLLPGDVKMALLLSKDKDNYPMCYQLASPRKVDMLFAYVTQMLTENAEFFTRNRRMQVVIGCANGCPAIHYMLEKGYKKAALAYAKAIVECENPLVSRSMKARMLNPMATNSGISALDHGVAYKKYITVRAYHNAIKAYCETPLPRAAVRRKPKPKLKPKPVFDPPEVKEEEDDVDGFGMCCVM